MVIGKIEQSLEVFMVPWKLIDRAQVPGHGGEMCLYQRGGEFTIRLAAGELMNSRAHGSEDALAELACARIADRPCPRVLIGGLGMGYTTAAALRRLRADAQVLVAELVPAVVKWNRGPLGEFAGHPLQDARVTVCEADIAQVLQTGQRAYDAILLDVDNGPEGLTRKGNDWLYAQIGLEAAVAALRPAGVLGVWSSQPNRAFAKRLRHVGFAVEEISVRARGPRGGPQHLVWLAQRA
jgi:spermidine synthase